MVRRTITIAWGLAVWMLAMAAQGGLVGNLRVVIAGGERYVTIKDVATVYGFSVYAPPGRRVYLQSKTRSLEFEIESRQAKFNGTRVWLHSPATKVRGKWAVTETDARKVLAPLLEPSSYLASREYTVVVLDPGHGGDDRGAKGRRNVEEKRVVLDVARRARLHLANAGLKVFLTRETDRFIELGERSAKAGRWGGDVFVSIHLNSAQSSAPSGLETFVLATAGYPTTAGTVATRSDRQTYSGNKFDAANTILGYHLQRALVAKAGGEDRGVRRARFMVLRNAPCPAALMECGFVSNAKEESLMLQANHREGIALAIAKGVLDYVDAVKKARVVAR